MKPPGQRISKVIVRVDERDLERLCEHKVQRIVVRRSESNGLIERRNNQGIVARAGDAPPEECVNRSCPLVRRHPACSSGLSDRAWNLEADVLWGDERDSSFGIVEPNGICGVRQNLIREVPLDDD